MGRTAAICWTHAKRDLETTVVGTERVRLATIGHGGQVRVCQPCADAIRRHVAGAIRQVQSDAGREAAARQAMARRSQTLAETIGVDPDTADPDAMAMALELAEYVAMDVAGADPDAWTDWTLYRDAMALSMQRDRRRVDVDAGLDAMEAAGIRALAMAGLAATDGQVLHALEASGVTALVSMAILVETMADAIRCEIADRGQSYADKRRNVRTGVIPDGMAIRIVMRQVRHAALAKRSERSRSASMVDATGTPLMDAGTMIGADPDAETDPAVIVAEQAAWIAAG